MMTALVGLSACGPQVPRPVVSAPIPAAPAQPEVRRAEIALLLPLSGQNAPIGQAMLNAAQLALFEQGGAGYEIVPRDTGGTAQGAASAARAALANGAKAVIGPLTSPETSAVAAVARAGNVPVLAFTNDPSAAAPGVWALGITPGQQVRRVVNGAAASGARRLALAAPETPFGRILAQELRASAAANGLPAPLVVTYPAAASLSMAARDLAMRAGEQGIDALLIGEQGARAREFAAALPGAGLAVPPLKIMGTSLWAGDAAVAAEPVLAGAVFPASDPAARAGFEGRYQAAFGQLPPRIAAIAYDAAALAVRGMRGEGPMASVSVPVGSVFIGAEGVLRLEPSGQVSRALAVFALTPGQEPVMVEPAVLPGGPNS